MLKRAPHFHGDDAMIYARINKGSMGVLKAGESILHHCRRLLGRVALRSDSSEGKSVPK